MAELLGSPPVDVVRNIGSEDALKHPYFAEYEDTSTVENVTPFDWSFTDDEISAEEWKTRVLHLIDRAKSQ
ncbi:hypothetical protein HDV02_001975 [Globomyces sp. JEL0801]|nr:hypothetical protein HDV02_001975 [Globomyces sp. JEL0801]